MAIVNRDAPNSLGIRKKYAWRDNLIRWVGTALILMVVLGTGIWLLLAANFSFAKSFYFILDKLRPEVKTDEPVKILSKEEQLQNLIEKEKIVEIAEIAKTPEGDLLLRDKNNIAVFFAQNKNLTDQVATLQTLLTKARIDNKALKKVDFRFEKIVVEY